MCRKLLRYLLSIGILLMFSFYVKGAYSGEMQLTNTDSKIIILSPTNFISDAIFEADTTITELTLESISTIANLEINLILPDGQMVNGGNLPASGITYNQVTLDAPLKLPIPTVFTLGGTHYRYTLSQPIAGTYTIHVDGTNKVNLETPVIINMFSNSKIGVAIKSSQKEYNLNDIVILNAFVFENGLPINGAQVDVSMRKNIIADPPPPLISFSLLDNGQDLDFAADDGIYSRSFIGEEVGEFVVFSEISGQHPERGRFKRTASTSFFINPLLAKFTKVFSDTGIDTNQDGTMEKIEINTGVDVTTAGEYDLFMELKGVNGHRITQNRIINLSGGNQNIALGFSAEDLRQIGVDGPYTVTRLRLDFFGDGRWKKADTLEGEIYQTQPYQITNFKRGKIIFTGNNIEFALDFDNNGKYDVLQFVLELDSFVGGAFVWKARLVDYEGREIARAGDSGNLMPGLNAINLSFAGNRIGESKISGPYYLVDFVISGEEGLLTMPQVMPTRAYLFTDFEGGTTDDNIPPLTEAKRLSAPSAEGWNNLPLTVVFIATDNPSGSGVRRVFYQRGTNAIVSADGDEASVIIDIEGETTITYFAEDNAGNREPAKAVTVRIDLTPPTITATANPPANAEGWNNSDVIVTFTCGDSLSGISSCPEPQVISAEGENIVATGTAVDKAGNKTTITHVLKIDKTPPEAVIYFEPAIKDLKVIGTDNLSETVNVELVGASSRSPVQYTLSDLAGNTLALVLEKKREPEEKKGKGEGKEKGKEKKEKEPHEIKAALVSMSYNGTAVPLPKNSLKYEWAYDKAGVIKELEQKIEVKEQFELQAKYKAKEGTTRVELEQEKDGEEEKEKKEILLGLVLLKLTTQQGGLGYVY